MPPHNPLVDTFTSFFVDPNGCFQVPENIGQGCNITSVCNEILREPKPVLFDTLSEWDGARTPKVQRAPITVFSLANALRSRGQWEGAWLVAQLHYDQTLKQEAQTGTRHHKGHPACGLAILARELGSPQVARHYALLSSAGDVYWEHQLRDLEFGGYGRTMLEQYHSSQQQDAWRQRIRNMMQDSTSDQPLYLEAFLAATWFDSHARHILKLAKVKGKQGKPFVEVLLDSVESPNAAEKRRQASPVEIGTQFEAAAGLLLASTPGFAVNSARRTADEQIDLVVHYSPDKLSDIGLPQGFGLVECKSSKSLSGNFVIL